MTRIKNAIVLLLVLAGAAQGAPPARVQETRPLMGTVVGITAEGADGARLHAAVGAAYREMGRLTDMMNHYDPKSVVSAINEAAGERPVATPPELFEVLETAQKLAQRTSGAFDITVGALRGWRFRRDDPRLPPAEEIAVQRALVDYRRLRLDRGAGNAFLAARGMRIDLGGIAKLYILRAGLRVLERHAVARAMVNGGGDVLVSGGGWRIGVRDPLDPAKLIGLVEIDRGAVVTSGDYERYFVRDGKHYHHILDPRTGYPSEGPRGVTLIGEVDEVNGTAIAIMVLGRKAGVGLLAATPAVDAFIADRDGSVWMSEGFRKRLREVPAAAR